MSKREIACVARTHTDNIFFKIMNHLEVIATVLCALFAALEIKNKGFFLLDLLVRPCNLDIVHQTANGLCGFR